MVGNNVLRTSIVEHVRHVSNLRNIVGLPPPYRSMPPYSESMPPYSEHFDYS